MTRLPAVSVVIPAHNASETLETLLIALVDDRERTSADLEIIVVNDGSTDRTSDVARRFTDCVLDDPRQGPAAARNSGVRQARHDVITFFDSDDLPIEGWLAQLAQAFLDPNIGFATWPAIVSQRGEPEARTWYPNRLGAEGVLALAGCFAMRRSVFAAIGGYDEELRVGENSDLCDRAVAHLTRVHQGIARLHHPGARISFGQAPSHYDELRVAAMEHLLERDQLELRDDPAKRCKLHALAAVNAARSELWSKARIHAWAALRAQPLQSDAYVRLAVALLPPLARRRWTTTNRRSRVAGPAGTPTSSTI